MMARPPKPKQKQNPIQAAVHSWLESLSPSLLQSVVEPHNDHTSISNIKDVLLSNAPKRWVVYEPMVLLPSGSFITQPWPTLLSSLSPSQKEPLWTAILRHISPANKPLLTHLAINEGIPLHLGSGSTTDGDNPSGQQEEPQKKDDEGENVLRSPTHLHPLHGDFGPPPSSTPTRPSQADFDAALWVTTKQNGLVQVWAPAHTMFSRGNVKEKARLLSFHDAPNPNPNPTSTSTTPQPPPTTTTTKKNSSTTPLLHDKKHALDLYAGIGYFAFPLARLGLRVLCWELNAWSVEGLRRGAAANGFSVRVVTSETRNGDGDGGGDGSGGGDGLAAGGVGGADMAEAMSGGEQIVVFLEDNRHAAGRVRGYRDGGGVLEVVHVNCGFLPTSEPVWRDAWGMVVGGEGWLHLHENVGVEDIEARRGEVQGMFDRWAAEEEQQERRKMAVVEHVELVKTYAPGVWHCVFDVFITTRSGVGE